MELSRKGNQVLKLRYQRKSIIYYIQQTPSAGLRLSSSLEEGCQKVMLGVCLNIKIETTQERHREVE